MCNWKNGAADIKTQKLVFENNDKCLDDKSRKKKSENCCWQTELKEKIWKGKKDGDWDAKQGRHFLLAHTRETDIVTNSK